MRALRWWWVKVGEAWQGNGGSPLALDFMLREEVVLCQSWEAVPPVLGIHASKAFPHVDPLIGHLLPRAHLRPWLASSMCRGWGCSMGARVHIDLEQFLSWGRWGGGGEVRGEGGMMGEWCTVFIRRLARSACACAFLVACSSMRRCKLDCRTMRQYNPLMTS